MVKYCKLDSKVKFKWRFNEIKCISFKEIDFEFRRPFSGTS